MPSISKVSDFAPVASPHVDLDARHVLNESTSDTPSFTQARAGSRFCTFLKNVPLLRDLAIVKSYVASVERRNIGENMRSMMPFLLALAAKHGPDHVVRGLELTDLHATSPLTQRNIQQLTSAVTTSRTAQLNAQAAAQQANAHAQAAAMAAPMANAAAVDRPTPLPDVPRHVITQSAPDTLARKIDIRFDNQGGVGSLTLKNSISAGGRVDTGEGSNATVGDPAAESAFSLPLPLMGANYSRGAGAAAFVTFGFNENALRAAIDKNALSGQEGPRSANVLERVIPGAFAPKPGAAGEARTPVDVVADISDQMHHLNLQAAHLKEFFTPPTRNVDPYTARLEQSRARSRPPVPQKITLRTTPDISIPAKVTEVKTKALAALSALNSLAPAQKEKCADVIAALNSCANDTAVTFDPLQMQAKNLVAAMHPFTEGKTSVNFIAVELRGPLTTANEVLEGLKAMSFQLSR